MAGLTTGQIGGWLRRIHRRFAREATFDLSQTIAWLAHLRAHGIDFVFPEEFTADPPARGLAVLKHDIHHDLDRAEDMARAEHAHAIAGIYFMMGPHERNVHYYGSKRAWQQLRSIQDMGHRIGLHLDIFDAIKRGGLYEFIAETVAAFSDQGIQVRYGNSHGNTKYQALGIASSDFFCEIAQSSAHAAGPISSHVAAYSLKDISDRFGIRYWVDSRMWDGGKRVRRALYVTDNNGDIRIPAKNVSTAPFRVDDDFVTASTSVLSEARTLILLHPQWHAARS